MGKLRSSDLRILTNDTVTGPSDSVGGVRNAAVEIRDATLEYPIGAFVRASLKSQIFGLFGHREKGRKPTYVSALKNVSLSFADGERVALIGSNGAGKSTLLRAIAGAYPLKTGSISVTGQIGTLLDLTLGFEVESTGRENIYYRGMAMGYSRAEMAAAEEKIITFADLGEFIDLPMRTYSAGMYVRLGFSVSTHFSPDVLLMDEVFGAGDASFSERALQRMAQIVDSAGIMLLATHDLQLVERLCNRVVWVNRGLIEGDGTPAQILPRFRQFMASLRVS